MTKYRRSTSYSLVPQDPKVIIQCVIGSCLAVAGFFGIVHLTALVIRVMS